MLKHYACIGDFVFKSQVDNWWRVLRLDQIWGFLGIEDFISIFQHVRIVGSNHHITDRHDRW